MKRTDPVPGEASEKSQAELEKAVETAFDKKTLEDGIAGLFKNGEIKKRAAVRTCIEEIKADLLEAVKGEDKKNWTEAIKKNLIAIADESFRAQKGIDPQQAVELVKIMGNSLRIPEGTPDNKIEGSSDGASDIDTGKETAGAASAGAPHEKKAGSETGAIVPYEFATGIKEKYLEGKSGKKKTEAEERLARCAKEIGAKIAEMKKGGKDIDENQIILSVIGKVKSLRAIFEADLKVGAAETTEKDDLVPGAGSNPEQNPVPEDEKKSPEFSKFLIALEEAKKNCAEQKVQGGAIQLIRMSPRKFGIVDNAELKLAYDAREKAYREIIGKMPRMENQGDNLTMAEFRAEFGEFKKNYYNDENVRLNIQKYDKRSGKAAIFIGESGKRQEVSIEELRKLRAVYKNAEKKKKPEGMGEKMTFAEFKAEFGDKVKKNLFDDSNNKMNIARYNRSGEATVYFGENGDKEDVSIEKLRELLAVYTNPEIKKKPEGKGKTFREVLDEVVALEEKSKADIRELRAERKLSGAALSDFLIDFSKIDLTGLKGGDKEKARDLMKQKNESIRDFYIDKLKKSKKGPETKKNPEAKKKSFREIFDEVIELENKAMAGIKAALENRKLAEVNLDDFLVDISKLDLEGLNKTDEKKARDLVRSKNEKIVEYYQTLYVRAEMAEGRQRLWEGFIAGRKENIDRAKNIKLGKIDEIDFSKMAAGGENIEVGNGYGIKLNDILNKEKKYPDRIRKEIEAYVEEANKEISRRLDAKKAEMKKFLADNHEAINSRKMDEMDRRLWEQGKKTFEEVALKTSLELDAELKKIGYWDGFSEEGKAAVLREKMGNFLFGKLVEKYALEAGEAKKRTDEILAAIGESPSSAAAKPEKNADARMEEVGQSVADRVFEKFGREIDLKIVAAEKKPASGIEKQSPVEKYPGRPASDAGDEEDEVYGGDIEPSDYGEEEDDVETDKGAVIEKVPKEEKISEAPQETVGTEKENITKKEATVERADVSSEEQKIKEKKIDPEKEERLQAFIKSYIDGGIRYKKLVESEKVKKIEAASEKEKQEKIKEMVGKMTLKTLDVLGRYSKEDREYVQKRVMEEIFG